MINATPRTSGRPLEMRSRDHHVNARAPWPHASQAADRACEVLMTAPETPSPMSPGEPGSFSRAPMPRVAIVGSCISRDVWRFQGATVADLLYISRTSLPSLFAAPVAGFKPAAAPPRGLKPQPHRALVADLQKTALASLLAFRPTHVVFDFIDERFDLVSAGDALA